MNIVDALRDIAVSKLDLSRYVTVEPTTTVAETVQPMNQARRSCAFVVEGGELVGIFTQRDVVTRVLGDPTACDRPVTEVMTPSPRTVPPDASVADALTVMTEVWSRSVPVAGDTIVGNVSFYTVMKLMSDLLADRKNRTESDLSAQHGQAAKY